MKRSTTAAILGLCLALAGTTVLAKNPKLKDGDVELLADWLAGIYDSAPQADGTAGDGHLLVVERVSSPMISWHVFYVEERDAGGTVVAEQLVSLELASDKRSIVQQSFSFKDPQRWRGGLERPDIFKSIGADDLLMASGCEVFWLRDATGYAGQSQAGQCRLRSRATGFSMQVDIKTKISAAEYTYGQRRFSKRAAGVQ
jgi:CpeT/CpcT family (DUF1001)